MDVRPECICTACGAVSEDAQARMAELEAQLRGMVRELAHLDQVEAELLAARRSR